MFETRVVSRVHSQAAGRYLHVALAGELLPVRRAPRGRGRIPRRGALQRKVCSRRFGAAGPGALRGRRARRGGPVGEEGAACRRGVGGARAERGAACRTRRGRGGPGKWRRARKAAGPGPPRRKALRAPFVNCNSLFSFLLKIGLGAEEANVGFRGVRSLPEEAGGRRPRGPRPGRADSSSPGLRAGRSPPFLFLRPPVRLSPPPTSSPTHWHDFPGSFWDLQTQLFNPSTALHFLRGEVLGRTPSPSSGG